jgi:hypothetical protein
MMDTEREIRLILASIHKFMGAGDFTRKESDEFIMEWSQSIEKHLKNYLDGLTTKM